MKKELTRLGIERAKPLVELPRLTIGVDGLAKEGKTTFAFTMPTPLGVITMDPMTKSVMRKEVAKGREIYECKFPTPNTQEEGKTLWTKYRNVYTAMLGEYRSLIIDTDTAAWAMQRMAAYGKLSQVPPNQYVVTNTRKRMMIEEAENSNCNVCFIYKVKKEYKAGKSKHGKETMGQWTGNYDRDGFGESNFLLQVNLRAFKEPPDKDMAVEKRFKLQIVNCTQNAELDGEILEHPMNDFTSLACQVFPESDPEGWE